LQLLERGSTQAAVSQSHSVTFSLKHFAYN